MPSQITTLINRPDTFEAVRDKIAQILADEIAQQVILATADGLDPAEWDAVVYTEKFKPWDKKNKSTMIINVWFDTMNLSTAGSSMVDIQKYTGIFNIDIIGSASSKDTAGGHIPGDEQGARNAHRGARLVRSILMAGQYTYLGDQELPRIISGRKVESLSTFQPQADQNDADNTVGVRVQLAVDYNEFAPQYQPQRVDELFTEVRRGEDGSVLAQILQTYET